MDSTLDSYPRTSDGFITYKYPNSVPGFRAFNLDLVPLTYLSLRWFYRCHPFFGQLSPLENSDIGK